MTTAAPDFYYDLYGYDEEDEQDAEWHPTRDQFDRYVEREVELAVINIRRIGMQNSHTAIIRANTLHSVPTIRRALARMAS